MCDTKLTNVPNPWCHFNNPANLKAPLFLPEDLKVEPNLRCYFQQDILPQPYVGNPDAKIVILATNPNQLFRIGNDGKASKTFATTPIHSNNYYDQIVLDNLCHKNTDLLKFFIDNTLWYRDRIYNQLFEHYYRQTILDNVFLVDFYPYFSPNATELNRIANKLYSFDYTCSLISRAISNNSIIVSFKNYDNWVNSCRCLKNTKIFKASNSQNSYLSRSQMGDEFFNELNKILPFEKNKI